MMRGGTSKGAYFLASDLPADAAHAIASCLSVMGSPDPRQIDGIGGADPLTSKVAVISPSSRPGIDVDYLFLQVWVDRAEVSDKQNCGNILAGVAPFAIEQGLVRGCDPVTKVRIFMVNTSQTVVATVQTPGGKPEYQGNARIDGVPGTAAPIPLTFSDTAGSTCGALLPTGRTVDVINGVEVTCIDNGMPVVVMRASDLGRTGYETRDRTRQGHRAQGAHRGDPPHSRSDDEPRRREEPDGAEDDPRRAAARRAAWSRRARSSRIVPTRRLACSPPSASQRRACCPEARRTLSRASLTAPRR